MIPYKLTNNFSTLGGYTAFSNVTMNHALESKMTWLTPISWRLWGKPQMTRVNITVPRINIILRTSPPLPVTQ